MRILVALSILVCTAAAQDGPPRFEVTAGAWRTSVTGEFQSGIVPVDLRQDLALKQAWQFHGSALIRLGGRHRLVLEGSPLSFSGRNELNRTVTYSGRTYNVRETIASDADLTTAFFGYQYDIVSRRGGHLGLRGGAAYVDATGSLVSTATGTSAADSYTVGLPLAGAEGRATLLPRWLDAGGSIEGMAFGGYGHFVQGHANVGVGLGVIGFRAGYRWLDADVHENTSSPRRVGVLARINGPVVSLTLRVR